jgi:hypothetical protein
MEDYKKWKEGKLMRRRHLLIIGVICGLLMFPNYAAAVVIDFDSLTPQVVLNGNIEGVNLGGVTITSAFQGTTVVSDFGIGYRSPSNAITNIGFVTYNPMTFVFDDVLHSVGFTGGDRGGDTDQFTVDLFDSANALLQTFTTPVFGGNLLDPNIMVDYYTVNFPIDGIKTMVVRNAINAGIGIDNLEFTPIPEPATMLLVGSGLVGLAGLRRKFRK